MIATQFIKNQWNNNINMAPVILDISNATVGKQRTLHPEQSPIPIHLQPIKLSILRHWCHVRTVRNPYSLYQGNYPHHCFPE